MALSQRLQLRQSQALVMTPQLMQAIKLLQLSNLDLATYVEGELERNPLLERDSEGDGQGEPASPQAQAAPDGDAEAGDWMGTDLQTSRTAMEAQLGTGLDNVFPDDAQDTRFVEAGEHLAGYQMLIRGEPMRARYRNSWSKPEPMQPNMPTKVAWEMPDINHTFLKGHRIMLQIQSSWFPLVDRNPQKFVNIYKATEADFQKASERVFWGSHLTVRRLPSERH